MWKRLIDIQKSVVPDILSHMLKRLDILSAIEEEQPIGRRTLSKQLGMTERVLRREVEELAEMNLIKVDAKGIALSAGGREVLGEVQPFLTLIESRDDLALQLKNNYPLKDIFVVRGDAEENAFVKEELARLMAEELTEALSPGTVVSVAGGSTMALVSKFLRPKHDNLLFVPARGGLGEEPAYQSNDIVANLAEAAEGQHRILYAPDSISEASLESLKAEPMVREIIDLNRRSAFLIHGIGDALEMARRRKVDEETLRILTEGEAVGETFGFYFNADGELVHKVKTIGLQLGDLDKKESIFAVAGGESKKEAVKAYLKLAPENTILIIDEVIARHLLA
ncbi:sugar-binding transcriptional regulator [Lacicoccus alkaliphilus]|uniref:Central glycolytic genes regulator n=1 Tax=Lacicoccus alkaliphilus DSM 16010 TaxID=1123231 RepID=A0A1M7FBQ1_9BACL|nr:sugar-binding domain-containing protein [Salinicoccus alkaliphilus]SHM01502.1 central glycolytic genes regulator [Salinicoccus alkaliphilus DSM 16010]